ncbi:hypothetical protein HELRODRAFT_177072 [Helobdella robusta]|uniref:Uncharacterized protein n=1 Tax=Helobdella robusta TaxID=6412 RepID=T1FB74_HELRO|nr:hypothetical protein HELRODRAFT_177072 [Helobdella robusta]ESN98209.1 hypothetical protein HELRODRAFT_177072 [Helobdella robusta]
MATLERKQMVLTTYMAVLAMENGMKVATASLSLLKVTGQSVNALVENNEISKINPNQTTFSPRSGVAICLPMMKPKYPSMPFCRILRAIVTSVIISNLFG